jgi:anti-sigma factor RsiW
LFYWTEECRTVHCERVRERLSAYLDGELPPEGLRGVEDHLRTCLDCRRAHSRLIRLGALLAEVDLPVPAGFAERVLAAAQKPSAQPATTRPVRVFRRLATQAAGAALVAASLLIGVFLGRNLASVSTPSQVSPPTPPDPLALYHLDSFGGVPQGSLPQSYLALASAPARPEE